jgi:hypothetical protein
MLTAAVRDLHRWYPGQFLTDVRTSCPEVWEHNPHITSLTEKEGEVIECSYPLIDRCNETPYHCLHGFIEFLNRHLALNVKPTAFEGDIHLSEEEKSWHSQVHEVTRGDIPFWVIDAGGKYDVTIKWWETKRYQEVVDHFRDRIQFVQVGVYGHHHPKLNRVIDLRGQTTLRELIRLVYHSQGVLCPVTALMHLAAAVEVKGRPSGSRPCVVVAGGREPAHWEAYPGHQFIHTNGLLRCCARGGCWRDRTLPLGDGDARDQSRNRCVDVVKDLPRCMDMIGPQEVIERIELCFRGKELRPLSPRQRRMARRGVAATARNSYDRQPLTLHSARLACEKFIQVLPAYPDRFRGRGIVICAGGVRYFTNAWVCIRMLRQLGCRLPIQVWHLGEQEMDEKMVNLLGGLGVECVNAWRVRGRHPVRRLGGWELKPYAVLHCPFEEVLLLDADNVPVVNPDFIFEVPEYRSKGAVFWPDYGRDEKANLIWRSCRLRRPQELEFETGQVVVNKRRCWRALCLTMWFNEHSDFYYRFLHGDKETFHLAFRKLKQPYALIPTRIHTLPGTMCQHDFVGRRIFQHRNTDKWNLFLSNRPVRGFRLERDCRRYVKRLQRVWDGRMGRWQRGSPSVSARSSPPRLAACMITCPEREPVRQKTLRDLGQTDWNVEPVLVQIDGARCGKDQRKTQTLTALIALRRSLESAADFILFLEDDLKFNRHLRHNLLHWRPLRERRLTLGGLYNPGLREAACDVRQHALVVEPHHVYGSQAFVISRQTVKYLVAHWDRMGGMQDIRMSRLAGRLRRPIYYHAPSLVQHVGRTSVWGGTFHQAADFDPDWRAGTSPSR